MKKILFVFLIAFMVLALGACGNKTPEPTPGPGPEPVVTQTFTVIFNSDGARFATVKVKEGEKITQDVGTPSKDGHSFVGWFDGDTQIDLATYTVTKDVTLEAKFVSDAVDSSLDVNAKKEEGKTYTLVIGWWEVTDPAQPDKKTSYLTEELVQKFYTNINLYLKVKGLTDAEIKNVQVRNYSTATVAEMGALVNADGDVDIMIGVGNNINSSAGVSLYEGSNDNKFATNMGSTPTSRYVALTSVATALGVNVYDWLYTEVGRTAFTTMLKESDIVVAPARTKEANANVNVYLDETNFEVLHFASKDDELTLPTLEFGLGVEFKGFATAIDGPVVLNKANGGKLTYSDIKDLLDADGNLSLYPVFEAILPATEDLVVYVQLNSGLTLAEAKLLEARFNATLTEEKFVKFVTVEADAAGFTEEYNAASCIDVVIGGNNPLKNFAPHADGPLANAGAKHFANTSRKVLINANCQHLDLAKDLYAFLLADAPEYELHVTFWINENKWITADELSAVKDSIPLCLANNFQLAEGLTLEETYNIKVTTYDATNTKVAQLGEETKAVRDGKGTDLIIGCGANVTSTGGFTDALVSDIPTSIIAADRKMALVTNNYLAEVLYASLFVEDTPEQ